MKTKYYRPQVDRKLMLRLRTLALKSRMETRILISTALSTFADARESILKENGNKDVKV